MPHFIHCFYSFIFCLVLICLSYIDINTLTLPDKITLPFIWLGLLTNIITPFTTLEQAVLGAIVGYSLFYVTAWLIATCRKIDGLGRGDAKLLALIGSWIGIEMLPAVIFIASLSGAIVGTIYLTQKRMTYSTQLPFGPFLAFAGILGLLCKSELLQYQFLITHFR